MWSSWLKWLLSSGCEFLEDGFVLRVVLSGDAVVGIKDFFTQKKIDGGFLGRSSP